MVNTAINRGIWLAGACLGLALLCSAAPPAMAAPAPPEIRVMLAEGAQQAGVSGELVWYQDGKEAGLSKEPVQVKLDGGMVTARIGGKLKAGSRLGAIPARGWITFGGVQYRGRIEFFIRQRGSLTVINVLPLEEYLYGTVPAEMPASWHPEALRAQAVAARTYALACMGAMANGAYDVKGSPADQAYRGVDGEDPRTSQAVDDTRSLILTYQGAPIVAYFCSDAGGCTRVGDDPYLPSVPSLNPDSPFAAWQVNLDAKQFLSLLGKPGASLGEIRELNCRYAASGHLLEVTVTGSKNSARLTGAQLRKLGGETTVRSTRLRLSLAGGEVLPLQQPEVVKSTSPLPAPVEEMLASYLTLLIPSYGRPWIAGLNQPQARKMRALYATGGQGVRQCTGDSYAFSDLGQPAPASGKPMAASPLAGDEWTDKLVVKGKFQGVVLSGGGFGHGLGMSQWGAKALAEQGSTYADILHYFYSGVELKTWDGTTPPPAKNLPPSDEFYQPFQPDH